MRTRALWLTILLSSGGALGLAACENDVTEAVVVDAFPAEGPDAYAVDEVWYRTTLFLDPLAPGEASSAKRVGVGTEPAYAILSVAPPGGDGGADAGAPRRFVARTDAPIDTGPGDHVSLVLSPDTTSSTCFGAARLSREDWDFITTRIFPGEAVEPFDAPCPGSAAPLPADAGAD